MGKPLAAIVGYAMTEVGDFQHSTPLELAARVFRESIAHAGVEKKDVEGLIITPEGFGCPNAMIWGPRLCEYFGLPVKSLTQMECGGASSAICLKYAAAEIALRNLDIAVVLAVDVRAATPTDQRNFLSSLIWGQMGLYGPYLAPYGAFTPIHMYAMGVQRYMFEYGVTAREIAHLPVVLREYASKNEFAQFRTPITVDDVLNSRMVSPPIHQLECCPLSDGAAAIVLASVETARKISPKPVWITAFGEYHDSSHFVYGARALSTFPGVEIAAKQACEKAGVTPKDVDLAEIYGVFAGTELITYEDFGFFPRGHAAAAVVEGRTRAGGDVPINVSGGRLSFGHPATATPLMEAIELCAQLRGEAGERQLPDPVVGAFQGEHGMVNGAVVAILEKGG
ncbi:MAG: thiolase family protein [bacterium]